MARQPQLLQLWRRNAVYGLLETDSDIGQPAWSVPDLLGITWTKMPFNNLDTSVYTYYFHLFLFF